VQIQGTTALNVQGTGMTSPTFPFGSFLQLGASWNNDLIGDSNRFAVSSIIEDWIAVFEAAEKLTLFAMMKWQSDSGKPRDLDECVFVELVAIIDEQGGLKGLGIGSVDVDFEPGGDFGEIIDRHGTSLEWTKSPGRQRVKQLWRIFDMRAGGDGWSASRRSGFEIERRVERDTKNPRCMQLTVTKTGAAESIDGLHTEAGSGRIEGTFHDLHCTQPPPPPPPPPTHEDPKPTTVPCDREELARRVDACIEQAKNDAIKCTVMALGDPLNPLSGAGYLICLEHVRQRLLECDRSAKSDTHCEDGNDDGESIALAAGLPPQEEIT
jgi:hypothetical protein